MTTTQPTRIGKSTVATCVGSIFAQVRHDDRVVAIDADTAFGTPGARGAAINFSVDIQKKPHPAGDRVVLTFDGKFLPYDWTAAEA